MTPEELIKRLKKEGFGWKKYAESVEAQGFVSPKQHDTMILMLQRVQRIKNARHQKKGKSSPVPEQHSADQEAMDLGAYF